MNKRATLLDLPQIKFGITIANKKILLSSNKSCFWYEWTCYRMKWFLSKVPPYFYQHPSVHDKRPGIAGEAGFVVTLPLDF